MRVGDCYAAVARRPSLRANHRCEECRDECCRIDRATTPERRDTFFDCGVDPVRAVPELLRFKYIERIASFV
jgi:hypothetical protein